MVLEKTVSMLCENMNRYFAGKPEIVKNVLICLLAKGHLLIEDVPGVGKTTLANTLAHSIDLSFGRIQFTPDTLPGDVVGVSVYNMKTGGFEYKEGAINRQIVLADEINRTAPKTQSAMLEAMEEGAITVDGKNYKLPEPFMVIATQNPVEFEGTYPLPEAELDRFMMRLSIGYPSKEEELRLTKMNLAGESVKDIEPVCDKETLLLMREEVGKVLVKDEILNYIRAIMEATRNEKRLSLGASPRAGVSLACACRARAFVEGRDFVTPDDVKEMARVCIPHRLKLTTDAKILHEDVCTVFDEILKKTAVPCE